MPADLTGFDPDAPCEEGDGLFGLPHGPDEAGVVVIPVPWEPTTSYRQGTARAPARVLEASWQVDLFDVEHRDAWKEGIAMLPEDAQVVAWNEAACRAVREADHTGANALAEVLEDWLKRTVDEVLERGAIPAVLGGDHSVPLGAIRAAMARHPGLSVLHIDAHADLREAYQGFEQSHASIMHNVLNAGLTGSLVQVGIRDLGRAEWARIQFEPSIRAFPWRELSKALSRGACWDALVSPMVDALGDVVWISVDIDGLDPALCPHTGTPVPGGLSWDQMVHLLRKVGESGRRIVGFDLVEVGDGEWDAIVGARLLYQLSATALCTA